MGNKIINIILLLLLLLNISSEDKDWFYERNKNIYCPNRDEPCYFNITYNNPYAPLIDISFLRTAILYPHYYYIYLLFMLPKNRTQNKFYLEATDIITDETVISNGDCYLINNTNNRYGYELRIYKSLLSNSTIRIKFLGLNPGFSMEVRAKFPRDLNIYYNGIMLTDQNSLNKSDILELMNYDEEMKQKIINQKERKTQAIEKANKILSNLFGKTLNTDIEYKDTFYTQIIPISPFLTATVTLAVGLEISTEDLFCFNEKEETMSNIISAHGDISIESDIFDDVLGDNLSVDNEILSLYKIYKKKVDDLVFNLGLDGENYSLTISFSLTKLYITLTFRFNDPITQVNFYEIEIKIEVTNKWVFDLIYNREEVFNKAINKAAEFSVKHSKDLDRIIYTMIGLTILIVLVILAAPAVLAALGTLSTAAISFLLEFGIMQGLQFVPARR